MKKITKSFISIEGYEEILNDIRSLLEKAKSQTFKIVDNLRVQTYWQIGERIAREEFEHKERADYGKQLIQKLALDLGFKDRRSIYYMLQFYKAYPIVTTVCSQLSWSHYRELILIQNQEERNFYEQQALLNSWSFRDLEKAIQDNLYNSALKEDKIIATTPTIQANIQKIFNLTMLNPTPCNKRDS